MHNKHAFSPGVLYIEHVKTYEIMSCFITAEVESNELHLLALL